MYGDTCAIIVAHATDVEFRPQPFYFRGKRNVGRVKC